MKAMVAVLEPLPELREQEGALDVPECVRRINKGNENAARALMEHLYPLVIKLVRAYLPRRTAEEDLVQTVFMKIFTHLKQYSGAVPIERWVSRITINTCLNELEKERIRPEWRFADLPENMQYFMESFSASDDPPASEGSMAAEIVRGLLRLLEPADRLVVRLLHMEEKSILEIAEITGWTVPMIKVRAFRARNKLRKHLRTLEPAMSAAL